MINKENIHLITGLSGGGAEHLVLELSKQAKQNGIKPLVISVSSLNDIEHKFNKHEIPCVFLKINSLKTIFRGIITLRGILKNKEYNPTIHAHMFHALLIAITYKVRYLSKMNIVFTLHNNSVSSFTRRCFLFLTKLFRSYDIIFSKNSKKWYLKNNTIIPNGIDLEKFKYDLKEPRKKGEIINFIFLGSLTEQKNPLILPEIVSKLLKEGLDNFVISVVGDGILRNDLEEAIKINGLTKKIILYGFRNDIPTLLKKHHCQIMPSLWEGMPISLLESGACGLPIISTPVGSIPDFLNEGNAYLNSPENFHLSMRNVINDYNQALRKADVFKDFVVQNYSIEAIYISHQNIYDQLN